MRSIITASSVLTLAIEMRCSEEQKINHFSESVAGKEHGTTRHRGKSEAIDCVT
jgi:hypothetical protein